MNPITQAGLATKVIGGKQYVIKLLPALKSLGLFGQILSTIGPSLAAAFDKSRTMDFVLPEDDMTMYEIALAFCTQMDKVDLELLGGELLNNCQCGGKTLDLQNDTCDDILGLFEFALERNFGDRFLAYFKAKGWEIPTLKDLIPTHKAPETPEDSKTES